MKRVDDFVDRLQAEFANSVEVEVDPPTRKGRVLVGVLYDRKHFESQVFELSEDSSLVRILGQRRNLLTVDECMDLLRDLIVQHS